VILVKDKDLVVPGEVLAEDDFHAGRGTFREENKICSSVVGLVSIRNKKISVIPLQSKYIPKRGDVVIGEINDIRFSMWGLDINSPYSGLLPASEVFGKEKRELEKVFDVGDVLFLRVIDVDEVKKVKLGLKGRGLGKFKGGILIYITPTKVPRLIGKKGSMINMIKDKTHCDIVVGQNGVVWVKGQPEMERIAEKVIKMIEEQAHTSGLTDRVRDLLAELTGEKVEDSDKEIDETFESEETEEEIETPSSEDTNILKEPDIKPEDLNDEEGQEDQKEDQLESDLEDQTQQDNYSGEGDRAEQEIEAPDENEENSEYEAEVKSKTDNVSTDSSTEEKTKEEEKKTLSRKIIESKLNFNLKR
jgi:exosome complex component RRP4